MADRVRLSLYCPTCLPGYHLPFFAAASSGMFADYGLIVEILDPPPPPGSTNIARVAEGGSDFCLTGVTYFLLAQKEAGDAFPARFVSVLHQRSALGAIVPEHSDMRTPADLGGRRVGRGEYTGWLADECIQAVADLGLEPPIPVPLANGEAPYALGQGDVDLVATFIDAMIGVGIKGQLPVRDIPLGADIYGSGLVANDSVSADVVNRMRSAVAAAFALGGDDLDAAVAEYCGRFGDVSPATARRSWALLEPFVGCPDGVGTMSRSKWERTLEWVSRAHGFGDVEPERVFRPDLAT